MYCLPNNENTMLQGFAGRVSAGFTLVEMLAVITVIGILCSILFQLGFYVFEKNDRSKAETELGAFRSMLGEYKISNRRFPQTQGLATEKDRAARLYMALAGLVDPLGNSYSAGRQKGSFIRGVSLTKADENEISYALDPWEVPYVYACPAPDGRNYLLFSKGPDGRASSDPDGTAKDDEDNIPSNYPSGEF